MSRLAAGAERIARTEDDVRRYLNTNAKHLDPLEGIWYAKEGYRVGIMRNLKVDRRDFVAIMDASSFFVTDYSHAKANSKYSINSVEDIRSVILTSEHVSIVESTVRKESARADRPISGESARLVFKTESNELGPPVDISPEEWFGFPKGTRFFHVATKPPLFELRMVKLNGEMKIVWARVYPFKLNYRICFKAFVMRNLV